MLAALVACGHSPDPVARLAEVHGDVQRQDGTAGTWKAAGVQTAYFINDAVRVGSGSATLGLVGTAAQIKLGAPITVRFKGEPGKLTLSVERGAVDQGAVDQGTIDVSGTGNYAVDLDAVRVGTVNLTDGVVKITPKTGDVVSLVLTGGKAAVTPTDSATVDLALNTPREVSPRGLVADAGVPDAPAPVVDAGVPEADAAPAAGDVTIEVTGRRAELLAPGQIAWKPLAAGAGALPHGSSVRLGPGTTARVSGGGLTLDLATGARVKVADGDELEVALEAGGAHVVAASPVGLALPGGAIALGGAAGAAAEARLDTTPRDTRVSVLRGGSKLTGGPGAELAMNRGETALLTRGGAIRVVEAIPGYFDFRVGAGESLTIHDPKPPTAVQFQFSGKCPDGGIIELDRDARFRTSKVSAGRDFANALIAPGAWAYRLRCTSKDTEGSPVASGRISVVRDDGRRPLPRAQGINDIDADGRTYRISYQSAIPNLVVHVRNPGGTHRLHLAAAGKEQTFDSQAAAVTVPGSQLHEGTYTYWIDRDGVRQDKVSTLIIDFDQTAPQVYIESPASGQAWTGDDIDVRGAVLPGWSAEVEDIAIPIDKQRRFSAKVGMPSGRALAIRLSHPQHGVHYYLRRQK